jgi:hypothetical protein
MCIIDIYKSKAFFFAWLESIPVNYEKFEVMTTDTNSYFSQIVTREFLEQILKNKYCSSDVLKNLIETKHQDIAENLREISDGFGCRKDFKLMIEEAFEKIEGN